MADYELIGLNEAVPDLRAPTSADRGVIVGGVLAQGLAELDGGADINGSRVATVADTNPLAQAVRVAMTAAASGSNGIQALDNANLRFGLGDFTLHWDGVTSGTTATAHLISKIGGHYYELVQLSTGLLRFTVQGSLGTANLESTVVNTKASAKFTGTYTRGSPNDTVTFYVDGAQLGAAVTTPTKGLIDPPDALNIGGRSSGLRENTQTRQAIIYNRALSAAEVLSLCVSGPALADIEASQTVLTSGLLVAGGRYRIDTFVAGDNFTNVGAASNASGVEFVATGTTPTTWTNSSSLRRIGITGQWNAKDAQSNTGQIFDSSGNKNHALLPAAGATIIGKETAQVRQVRWTNAWDGTNELQYIGGVNQAILPANAYIESIVGTVSGATPHDIIIGDGSDTDRYVTITTGLAAGTTSFTLASRTTDGTNLKLTVDPDTNSDMSIAWVITYTTLE